MTQIPGFSAFEQLSAQYLQNGQKKIEKEDTTVFSANLEKFMEKTVEDTAVFSPSINNEPPSFDFTNMTRQQMVDAAKHLWETGVLTTSEYCDVVARDTYYFCPNLELLASLETFNFIEIFKEQLLQWSIHGGGDDRETAFMKILEFAEGAFSGSKRAVQTDKEVMDAAMYLHSIGAIDGNSAEKTNLDNSRSN